MNATIVFVLAIINAFVSTYIINPSIAIFYSAFKRTSSEINFAQIMASREIFFGAGRVVGLMMLVFLSKDMFTLAIAAVLMNLFPIVSYALFRNAGIADGLEIAQE
jgi:YQGE family putative transporter